MRRFWFNLVLISSIFWMVLLALICNSKHSGAFEPFDLRVEVVRFTISETEISILQRQKIISTTVTDGANRTGFDYNAWLEIHEAYIDSTDGKAKIRLKGRIKVDYVAKQTQEQYVLPRQAASDTAKTAVEDSTKEN